MIYTGYTKTDTYYEFVGSEGKLIMPTTDVILTDDESGMIAIKNTASRCTVGLLKKGSTPPTPPAFQGKWLATYSDSSTSSADCDVSSAVTSGEVTTTNLTSIEFGDCVISIGENAFSGCTSISGLTIGTNVTDIAKRAFRYCSGINAINIPSSVITLGQQAFQGCSGATSIILNEGTTTIGVGTFSQCNGITSVDIPSSVTTLGQQAFLGCSGLTSVTIGSGVTSIGLYTFQQCSALTSVTIEATTPPFLGANAFSNTNDCPIYVPSASVEAYKAAEGWTGYASRIQAIQ